MVKKDCFALRKNKFGVEFCDAGLDKKCKDCNFYRNDLDPDEIDKEIEKYSKRR